LRQHATEQQAYRSAAAGDRSVNRERGSSLARLREGDRQQRQSSRSKKRGESALQRSRRDQHGKARRGATDHRGDREAGQTYQKCALASGEIRDPAPEEKQAAERERV